MHIMSRQYRVATLLAASLVLLLGGCSSSNLSLTKRIDYKSASSTSALELPPDLTTPRYDDRYQVNSASGLAARGHVVGRLLEPGARVIVDLPRGQDVAGVAVRRRDGAQDGFGGVQGTAGHRSLEQRSQLDVAPGQGNPRLWIRWQSGGHPLLDDVSVVAFVDAARRAAARGGDGNRQVQQQRQVGLAQVARQRGDPGAVGLVGLVRERRQQVAIADDVLAGSQRRLDLAAQVVAPIGGEQQRNRRADGGRAVGQPVIADQDLP